MTVAMVVAATDAASFHAEACVAVKDGTGGHASLDPSSYPPWNLAELVQKVAFCRVDLAARKQGEVQSRRLLGSVQCQILQIVA
jgi:hypothetical protein